MIEEAIKGFSKEFIEASNKKNICIISNFDTDGIISAAIFSKTLERLNKKFSIKILKQLNKQEIDSFPKEQLIILLGMGSNNLEDISSLNQEIFIIDNHELIPFESKNLHILNPHLFKEFEELCISELSFLISREFSQDNKDLSQLSIIGMIGDNLEKEISKTRSKLIKESEVKIRKGLLIYPSTRPLDKALEFCSRPFIPGVTGDAKGTYELLKEAGIEKGEKGFRSLIELEEEEMKRLVTAVALRLSAKESSRFIGNLYLVKFYNKLEDARELSAIINACSRMGKPEIALMLCLGNSEYRKKAERIYFKYRQHIISGLKYIENNEKIQGREYIIINAKDNIKDTIIGTIASILSFSPIYKEGTIIIAMAYNEDKIKVSTRIAGRDNKSRRNLKDFLESIAEDLGAEFGGHKQSAGCTIKKDQEEKFIELVKKKLEYELIKV
ncbi:MAG: DHH family phosphoesterase [Candidatus Pacearchaeota archaeon]|jgi:RecJ-like exonuclease